ncbi:MAG TPA: DUF3817 domain-containing protein [Micromonosporaceae bacterium]|nr:DUF3817 domain-containing protein [Micromonosporaceae bacterium]
MTTAAGHATERTTAHDVPPRLRGALLRYRTLAYIVGVLLIVLVSAWAAGASTVVHIVGFTHGMLYIVYLLLAFDLSRRARWSLRRVALLVIAGFVPVLTFFVERWITHRTIEEQ